MKLKCINITTTNVEAMRDFYSSVFQAENHEIVPGRNEISAGGVTLVITHSNTKTQVNPDCCGLEFEVEDVDAEYGRLRAQGIVVPNPPVTYPWGFRAIGFQDPDGNNIDFVAYVGAEK